MIVDGKRSRRVPKALDVLLYTRDGTIGVDNCFKDVEAYRSLHERKAQVEKPAAPDSAAAFGMRLMQAKRLARSPLRRPSTLSTMICKTCTLGCLAGCGRAARAYAEVWGSGTQSRAPQASFLRHDRVGAVNNHALSRVVARVGAGKEGNDRRDVVFRIA